MPKRNDIKKIMIIGSGPIIIGQACEFDYSGTQACKALREEGYETVLVNSNPATIMTDPEIADRTYIEPLTPGELEKIIEKERPDALLPNLGGQTGLNLASELSSRGVLEKYSVKMIGVKLDAIEKGEDRITFKKTMSEIGVPVAKSEPCGSVEEAESIAEDLGYPVVLRPAYTMGGTGGGIAYNVEELRTIVTRGLAASMVHQVLVEESVLGWEELEVEIVRDEKGQRVSVCFIENVDPMGVHTGDSFCVAPMLTVPDSVREKLQEFAYKIADSIEVVGGTNVQFAHNPETGRMIVIEINPRTSRSSALASKATGFPIAFISAKLATGITLDELPYWKGGSLEKYEPSADYVIVKFARWAFEKFPQAKDVLGTQMKAVGEVMSAGKNFKEAFQKAIRSLEIKRYGLRVDELGSISENDLRAEISVPSSQRFFMICEAIRRGFSVEEIHQITKVGKWFLNEMKELVEFEIELSEISFKDLSEELISKAKKWGFSDKYIAGIFDVDEDKFRKKRISLGIIPSYCSIPVSGVERGEYFYSTYSVKKPQTQEYPEENTRKIMILGGGPNRIGQGIEFDYACVHATFALKEAGYETIMVNCNPETVSTDYDTSDRLYFEPLTVEDVMAIYDKEKPHGVIVQFGGQTPLNIARDLEARGVRVLGTSPGDIHLAEDRENFSKMMTELKIPQPESGIARSLEEALAIAGNIGYPLMVRPSYVLGGRGMEIIYDEEMLKKYALGAILVSPEHPMLIDKFLADAIEAEVDAISDGKSTFVAAIMEHIEPAGVHSGDSACVIPSLTINEEHLGLIEAYSNEIAKQLNVCGIMNIQFAICDNKVYILEANPRASRTVPIVSKITNIPIARIATMVMMGKKISGFEQLKKNKLPYYGVKEAVFPFNMFPEVDPLLGPEMRATGEVMGVAETFGAAFFKAQQATGARLPKGGLVLITVSNRDKERISPIAKELKDLKFDIVSTEGTAEYLSNKGIDCTRIKKIHEGRPNIADAIKNGEISFIINTPVGKSSMYDDSFIRMMAIQKRIPYITSVAAAKASVEGIRSATSYKLIPRALQDFHKDLNR